MIQKQGNNYSSLQILQVAWWLGSCLAFILIIVSFHPFTSEKNISQFLGLVSGIAIFGSIGLIWLTAGIWCRWLKIQALIQSGIAIFLLILNLVMINDLLAWSEWRGFPPVMEWGLYCIYSNMLPIVYFSGFIAMTLVLMANLQVKGENSIKKPKIGQIWVGLGGLGIGLWMNMFIFINHGILWVLVLQIGFICLVIFDASIFHFFPKTTTRHAPVDTSPELPQAISQNFFHLSRRDLNHGIQTLIKLELFGGFLLILNIFPFLYLVQIFNFPNLIPLFLQFFPYLIIGTILWGIIYHITQNREIILLGSTITLIPVPMLIGIDPYGIFIYHTGIMWMLGLSIPGIWLGTLLYTRSMVNGHYVQSFWGIGIVANLILGNIFGSLIESDEIDPTTGQYGLVIIASIIILLILGKIISKLFPYQIQPALDYSETSRSSQKFNSTQLLSPQSFVTTLPLQKVPHQNPRETKIALSLLILIASGLCIVPLYAINIVQNGSSEQILGVANEGDYYIWFADSLRTIDSRYRPNFAASPFNPTVRLGMAQGEHEGFQAIFTPGQIKSLNLWSFSPKEDLIHIESGDRIGKGNISVFNVEYVSQLTNQFPDRLIPFSRVDTTLTIAGQVNYPFYLDVFIPKDKPLTPGIYTTTIRSHCYDYHDTPPGIDRTYQSRDVEFILEVEVFNFTIPTQRHIGTEIIWGIPEQEDWIRFYQNHRLDPYWPISPVLKYNITSIEFDWVRYTHDITLGFELGMKYFPVTWHPSGINWTNLSYTPQYQRLLEWYIGNITTFLEPILTPWNTSALDSAYYFIIDEPAEQLDNMIIEIAKIIHSISPQLRIMETMNRDLESYGDDFLTEVDIYVQHMHTWKPSIAYPSSTPLILNGWPARLASFIEEHTSSRKKELWVYLTHNRFPFPDTDIYMTGVMQRNSFWLYWSYQIEGWLYWSFNWGTDLENGYGYAGYGESTLVGFGSENRPIGSLRLERVRDGIEDYEYFWLLNYSCYWLEINGMATEAEYGRDLLEEVDQMFNHPEYLQPIFGTNFDTEPFLWAYEPNATPYQNIRISAGLELGHLFSMGIIPVIY